MGPPGHPLRRLGVHSHPHHRSPTGTPPAPPKSPTAPQDPSSGTPGIDDTPDVHVPPPPNSLDEVFQEEPGIAQDLEEEGGAGGGGRRGGGGTHDTAPTSSLGTPGALPGEPRGWGRLRNALASPVPRVCARVAARGAVSHTPAQKRRPPRNRGRPGEGELHAFPPLPHRHRRRAREDRRPRRGTTAVGGRANRPRPSPICRLSPAN